MTNAPSQTDSVQAGPSQLRVYVVCVVVATLGALATSVAFLADFELHPVPLAVLSMLLLYAQVRPHRTMHQGNHALGVQFDELLFVPLAVFLSMGEGLAAYLVSSAVALVLQRKSLDRFMFNLGQLALSVSAGLVVARSLGSDAPGGTLPPEAAAAVGAVALALTSFLLVSGMVAYAQRSSFSAVLSDQGTARILPLAGAISLGVVATLAVEAAPWSLPLALVAAFLVQSAYVRALDQWESLQRTEAMYVAADEVRSSLEVTKVHSALLDAATTLLGAGEARLVPPGAPSVAGALRTPLNSQWSLEVASRRGGGAWESYDESALRALVAIGDGALRNAMLFEQLQTITSSQGEGVIAVDHSGQVTFANPAAKAMVGAGPGALVGALAEEVFSLEVPGSATGDGMAAALVGGLTVREDDALLRRPDGKVTPVAFTTSPLISADLGGEDRIGAVVVIRDITERKAFEEKLTHQAFHDPLTGLPNRRLFLDRLAHAVTRTERTGAVHGVLLFDIDRFKLVNDSLGHAAGDALLVELAERICKCVGTTDTFARLSGDEFTILVEDLSDPSELTDLAERVMEAAVEPFVIDGHELFSSVSIGIADTRDPVARADLRAAADVALYVAKSQGRGRYSVFAGSTSAEALARLDLETSLRRAVERPDREFELHYQPIVDTHTGTTVAMEALVRWNIPGRGMVSPAAFIPLAEETGLIRPIGSWVLKEACRQTREWTLRHPELPPLSVSVNLSARQFAHPGIVAEVEGVLSCSGISPDQLTLEITETVIMDDAEVTIKRLGELKALGVKLAIDDFGTGYSSLSYLKRFPVDSVKIDRAFVSGLGLEAVDSEIVAAVVRLAAAVGMRTVAEGVETSEQDRLLAELGCPLSQGFYHARPLPAPAFEAHWAGAQAA